MDGQNTRISIEANLQDNVTSRLRAISRNLSQLGADFRSLNRESSNFSPRIDNNSLLSFSRLNSQIRRAMSSFRGLNRESLNFSPMGGDDGDDSEPERNYAAAGKGKKKPKSRPFIGGNEDDPWIRLVTEAVPPITLDLDVVISQYARKFVDTALGYVKKAIFMPFQFLQRSLPERVQDELSDVKTAGGLYSINRRMEDPVVESFAEAEKLTRETNRYLAELAGALPGSTEEYVAVSKQIQDGIMQVLSNDTDNAVKLAERIAQEQGREISKESRQSTLKDTATQLVGEMTKLTVLAGLGGNQSGAYGLPMLVERMIAEDKVSMGMFQRYAAIFRDPMIKSALERNIDNINKSAKNTADRYEALIETFEEIVTPELIRRYQRTISGSMEAIRTAFLSPEVGLFGLGRQIDIIGDEIVYQYDDFGFKILDGTGYLIEEAYSIFDFLKDIFFNVVWSILPIIENFGLIFDPFANLIPALNKIRENTMFFQRSYEGYFGYMDKLTDQMIEFVSPFSQEMDRLSGLRHDLRMKMKENFPDDYAVEADPEGVNSILGEIEEVKKAMSAVRDNYEAELREMAGNYTWLGKWLEKHGHVDDESFINLMEKDLTRFRATSGLRASLNNISYFLYRAGDLTGAEFNHIADLLEDIDFTNFGGLVEVLAERFMKGEWAKAIGEAVGSIVGTAIKIMCDMLMGADNIITGSSLLAGMKSGFNEAGGTNAFWCIVRRIFQIMIKGIVMLFTNLWFELLQLFLLFNVLPALVQGLVRRTIQMVLHPIDSRGGGSNPAPPRSPAPPRTYAPPPTSRGSRFNWFGGRNAPINSAPPSSTPSTGIPRTPRVNPQMPGFYGSPPVGPAPSIPRPTRPTAPQRQLLRGFGNFGGAVGKFGKSIGKWNIITTAIFTLIDVVMRIMSGQDIGEAIAAGITTLIISLLAGTLISLALGAIAVLLPPLAPILGPLIPILSALGGGVVGSMVTNMIFPQQASASELPENFYSLPPEIQGQWYKEQEALTTRPQYGPKLPTGPNLEPVDSILGEKAPLWQRIWTGFSKGIARLLGWIVGGITGGVIGAIAGLNWLSGKIHNFLWYVFITVPWKLLSSSDFRVNVSGAISNWLHSIRDEFLKGIANVVGEENIKRFFPEYGLTLEERLQNRAADRELLDAARARWHEQFQKTGTEDDDRQWRNPAGAAYKGSGTDSFMPLPRAIATELKHKPPGSNLVIANSSELIIPTKSAANGNGDVAAIVNPLHSISSYTLATGDNTGNAITYLNNLVTKSNENRGEIASLSRLNASGFNLLSYILSRIDSTLISGIKVEVTNTPTVKMSFDTGDLSFEMGEMDPIGGGIGNFPKTSGFGQRNGSHHAGNDYAMPVGTRLAIGVPGRVIGAGWWGGYGLAMDILSPTGMVFRFAHLSRFLAPVGATLPPNTPFALSGNTGRSTGPHLHFEAKPGGGTPINPDPFASVIRANFAGMEISEVMGGPVGQELSRMPYGSDLVVGNSSEIMMKPGQTANLISSSVRAGVEMVSSLVPQFLREYRDTRVENFFEKETPEVSNLNFSSPPVPYSLVNNPVGAGVEMVSSLVPQFLREYRDTRVENFFEKETPEVSNLNFSSPPVPYSLVNNPVGAGVESSGSVTISGMTININGSEKSGKELADEIAAHILGAIESANYSTVI